MNLLHAAKWGLSKCINLTFVARRRLLFRLKQATDTKNLERLDGQEIIAAEAQFSSLDLSPLVDNGYSSYRFW